MNKLDEAAALQQAIHNFAYAHAMKPHQAYALLIQSDNRLHGGDRRDIRGSIGGTGY